MANSNNQNNNGKKVEDIVQDAIKTGDFSSLAEIGPLVQNSVNDMLQEFGIKGNKTKSQHNINIQYSAYTQNNPTQKPYMGYQYASQRMKPKNYKQNVSNIQQYPKYNKPSVPSGTLSIVLGSIGTAVFGFMAISTFLVALASGSIGGLITGGIFLSAGLVSSMGILRGKTRSKQKLWINWFYNTLQQRNVATFEEIAAQIGKPEQEVKKQAQKLLAENKMPNIRIDKEQTCLMYGEETYQYYLESEKSKQEQQQQELERQKRLANPEIAGIEHFKEEGKITLQKIQHANHLIQDENVSKQLDTLEMTVGKIFSYVAQHPEKLPETRRFMNYYLPTCLKLVEAYCKYETMDVQVNNVLQAKKEIESALGSINHAFNNLLEELYEEEVLDVTTDIEVLGAMLEQEGLSGSKFGQNNKIEAEEKANTPTLKL